MVRRRVLLAAAGAAGITTGLSVRAASAAVTRPLATVSVDLSKSLGAFPFGLGRQLSATPKSWRYGADTNTALESLALQRARVWLKYPDLLTDGSGELDFTAADEYLTYYHALADRLLLNWQTGYDALSTADGFNADAFVAAQRDALSHFKRSYPKIELIEVENEDFGPGEEVANYYAKYVVMYRAVNGVNADIAAGRLPGPALKVGGPTLDIFSTLRLGKFLDAYAADTRPDKKLDFISYHQYLIDTSGVADQWAAFKDYPAVVATERATLLAMLKARGLPAVPSYVSEVGIFPMTRASTLGFDADLHIQAAGVASLHYHYAGQSGVTSFDWTIDHPENDRKDLFVDTATGVPRPYFNTLKMLSMLPTTRYAATSDSLTARGTGVYGLAGANARQIAVMTWNYQWTGQQAYDSRIILTNFPAAFHKSLIEVTRYRLDAATHSGAMAPVETFVIDPRLDGTYYSQTLPLEPNELRLIVLTIRDSGVTTY